MAAWVLRRVRLARAASTSAFGNLNELFGQPFESLKRGEVVSIRCF
jgi:hypothetical protein